MKPLPENQLDPRVKNVWRFNDALWICIVMLPVAALCFVFTLAPDTAGAARVLLVISLALWALMLLLWVVVLPPIRFMRWRYEITPEYLDIARGIVWRKRFITPFIRVQNTDTQQGPIMRLFGLSSVTVSTAASEHVIPGLDADAAEQLRDRAAELARLAREDV